MRIETMDRTLLHHTLRQCLARLPKPFDNHYGVVPPTPPIHAIPSDALSIASAMRLLEATRSERPTGTLGAAILNEAISSCAIEGIETTSDEVVRFIETGQGTSAARLAAAYRLALSDLIPVAATTGCAIFTVSFVQRIHATIMADANDYKDVPGELRRCVVWIGSGHIGTSTWNPPPPSDVAVCLEENLDYMRNEGMQQMTQNVIARMAVAHAHFEAVHPFLDGNGRLGRLLLPLMMAASGYRPEFMSSYLETNVGRYFGALRKAQQKIDWAPLIELFADAIARPTPAPSGAVR